MSEQYNLNQKYKIFLNLDLYLKDIVDYFPNLEGLIFELLEDNTVLKEVLYDNFIKAEGEYSVINTSFDIVNIEINNIKITNIQRNE